MEVSQVIDPDAEASDEGENAIILGVGVLVADQLS